MSRVSGSLGASFTLFCFPLDRSEVCEVVYSVLGVLRDEQKLRQQDRGKVSNSMIVSPSVAVCVGFPVPSSDVEFSTASLRVRSAALSALLRDSIAVFPLGNC